MSQHRKFTDEELRAYFEATTDTGPLLADPSCDKPLTVRQIKRRKEKQIVRWPKRMGPMPVFLHGEDKNIPNRSGRNVSDEEGNPCSPLLKTMGAKGRAITNLKRVNALETKIRRLMEDPEISSWWGNPKMKRVIAQREGVGIRTVGNWFIKFPRSLFP